MELTLLKAKIHRARVTEANLDYEGSITIDPVVLDASGILPFEQVDIANINNGARFQTYVIEGERGSGSFCLNGAAARLVTPGDKIIIMSYARMTPSEASAHKPRVVLMDEHNKIKSVYNVEPGHALPNGSPMIARA
jgi:aspartate 1-decarboxylase